MAEGEKMHLHSGEDATHIMDPNPVRHCIPINEMGGWIHELIGCVLHRMRWHCVYSAVGGGRDAVGIVCRNLPPKRAICVKSVGTELEICVHIIT